MIVLVVLVLLLLALVFGPQIWVRRVMSHYARREEMPGTGGELAHHLVERFELRGVAVETTEGGDHYDPQARAIRLSPEHFNGRSITAAAVAAHEFGHALQHHEGYQPLLWRGRLAVLGQQAQRMGAGAMMALPVVAGITRSPGLAALAALVGVLSLGMAVVVHLVTLPVETDASFRRALPILRDGQYIRPEQERGVRRVLRAAAMTYVAAALGSLLNLGRWLSILRGGRLL